MSHSSSNYESRSLTEGFDKGGIFDLGHPLLNRIVESFVKAAGVRIFNLKFPKLSLSSPDKTHTWVFVFARPRARTFNSLIYVALGQLQIGAIQAVSREAYLTAVDSEKPSPPPLSLYTFEYKKMALILKSFFLQKNYEIIIFFGTILYMVIN